MTEQDLSMLEGHDSASSDFGAKDVSLPYLSIVQALSPIMRRTEPRYNPDAREGMIVNTITGRLTEKVHVVIAKYIRRVSEWKPNRGGFVRDHGTAVEVFDNLPDSGSAVRFNSAGNEVRISNTYFVVDVTDDHPQNALIDFSGVHSKVARRWNGLITTQEAKINGVTRQLPIFSRVWILSTVPDSNDKGQWMTWSFSQGPLVPSIENAQYVLDRAIRFRKDAEQMALPPPTADGQEHEPRRVIQRAVDDDVPF